MLEKNQFGALAAKMCSKICVLRNSLFAKSRATVGVKIDSENHVDKCA